MLDCAKFEFLKISSKRFILILILGFFIANGALFVLVEYRQEPVYFRNRVLVQRLDAELEEMSPRQVLEKCNDFLQISDVLVQYQFLQLDGSLESQVQASELLAANLQLQSLLKSHSLPELVTLRILYEEVEQRYVWLQEYPKYLDYVNEQADQMQQVNIFNEDSIFSRNNAKKTAQDFDRCRNLELTPGNDRGVEALNRTSYTDVFVIVLLLVITTIIFLEEQENGLQRLIASTRNGHIVTAFSKQGVALLCVLGSVLLFYGCDLALAGMLYGFPENERILQSIRSFRECTIPLTVGQYQVLFIMQKVASMELMVLFFSVLTLIFRNGKIVYLISILFTLVEFSLFEFLHPASILNPLKYLNLFYAVSPTNVFTIYANLNVGGNAVGLIPCLLGVCLISLIVMGALFILFTMRPVTVVFQLPRLVLRSSANHGTVSLLRHELWRILICGRSALVWIVGLALVIIWINHMPIISMDYHQAVYKKYITQFEGELTEEKATEIEALYTAFQDIPAKSSTLEQKYLNGMISKEEYDQEMGNLVFFSEQREDFMVFYLQFQRVQHVGEMGYSPVLLDKTSTDYLFDSVTRDLLSSILSTLLLILVVLPIGIPGKDALRLIRSTTNGRIVLFHCQNLLVLCFTIGILLGKWVPIVWNFWRQYKIADWNAPIQNLENWVTVTANMNIWQFLILWGSWQILAYLIFAQAFYLFTIVSQRATVQAVGSLILIGGALGCGILRVPILNWINPAMAFCAPTDNLLNNWWLYTLVLLFEVTILYMTGRHVCQKINT